MPQYGQWGEEEGAAPRLKSFNPNLASMMLYQMLRANRWDSVRLFTRVRGIHLLCSKIVPDLYQDTAPGSLT